MRAMTTHEPWTPGDRGDRPEPVRAPIDPFPMPSAEGGPAAGAVPEPLSAEAGEPVPPTRKRGTRALAFGAAAALLVGVGAGAGALTATAFERPSQQSASARSGTGTSGQAPGSSGSAGDAGPSFGDGSGRWSGGFGDGSSSGAPSSASAATAATAAQSEGVVTIGTRLGYQSGSAAGTGIVLTSSGEVLTNNHVIEGATSITVTDESTDRSYPATVVGTDATHDVAVLQLKNASGLTTASIASGAAKVGDPVVAVGNAGGTGTLSAAEGRVTALKQSITTAAEGSTRSERLSGLIETDADVVSGDSGGPLLNASGQVVGIDTAASSGTRDVEGYAIPIASALSIADTIEGGTDTADITIGYPAFLGVSIAGNAGSAGGAIVGSVLSGTPAAATGLARGDVITAVDGDRIGSATALTTRLRQERPGATVTITWTSPSGSAHRATVTLVAGPAD